jgi:DNA-binding transcriptional ArsR family regulator
MAQSSSPSLSHDKVYTLLSSARRRYVLYFLCRREESVQLGELTDHLAAWENDTDIETLDSGQRKRVYVSLYQTHLPSLEEAGLVEFDEDDGVVTLTGRSEELGEFLACEEDQPRQDWHRRYLAVAGVGGILYVLASANVPIVGLIPGVVVGLSIVAGVALLAILHYSEANERESEPAIDVLIEE